MIFLNTEHEQRYYKLMAHFDNPNNVYSIYRLIDEHNPNISLNKNPLPNFICYFTAVRDSGLYKVAMKYTWHEFCDLITTLPCTIEHTSLNNAKINKNIIGVYKQVYTGYHQYHDYLYKMLEELCEHDSTYKYEFSILHALYRNNISFHGFCYADKDHKEALLLLFDICTDYNVLTNNLNSKKCENSDFNEYIDSLKECKLETHSKQIIPFIASIIMWNKNSCYNSLHQLLSSFDYVQLNELLHGFVAVIQNNHFKYNEIKELMYEGNDEEILKIICKCKDINKKNKNVYLKLLTRYEKEVTGLLITATGIDIYHSFDKSVHKNRCKFSFPISYYINDETEMRKFIIRNPEFLISIRKGFEYIVSNEGKI